VTPVIVPCIVPVRTAPPCGVATICSTMSSPALESVSCHCVAPVLASSAVTKIDCVVLETVDAPASACSNCSVPEKPNATNTFPPATVSDIFVRSASA